MHHIAADGWSLGVFTQELNQLYNAFAQNQPSPLSELPLQYADFSCWQRNYYQGKGLESQLNYWQEKFQGDIPILNLPSDRLRPPLETFQGSLYALTISSELTSKLKQLSKQLKVTLFMVLLTTFKILLYRYTHEEDIIVGTPIAARNHLEIEGLIGFFVNTLALKTNLSGNPTFTELLTRVQQTAEEAYLNQELPYEKLIQELNLERDLSRSALTQVMFSFQNTPETSLQLSELEVSSYGIKKTQAKSNLSLSSYLNTPDNGTAKRDLSLLLKEEGGEIGGVLEYSSDLFDLERIKRLVEHFQVLLTGIVANPQQQLSYLPLLTPREKDQLLVEWNDTEVNYPKEKCIHQLFEEQVEKTPDAVAVVFEAQQLTYQQLNEKANQLAHYLQKFGLKPETLVGIYLDHSLEMIIGLLGILKAGAGYCPLDIKSPPERLKSILEDSKISLVLTHKNLEIKSLNTKVTPIYLDQDWSEISLETTQEIRSNFRPFNVAYLIYTSGSTGEPKGVVIEHRQIVNYIYNIVPCLKLTPCKSFLLVQPLFFDSCLTTIWGSLSQGGTLHIIPPEKVADYQYYSDYFNQHNIDFLKITPSHLEALASSRAIEKILPQKCLVIGGESSTWNWVKSIYSSSNNCSIFNHYGPTETTVGVLTDEVTQEMVEQKNYQITPIGKPIGNIQIYILDEYLQPVPIGVAGELHIAGDGLARNYLNRPQLTAEKFIDNPFKEGNLYKTGDKVRYLADGKIEFIGRIDDQVKIRGFRIELGEIEAVLVQHLNIKEAVVMAREYRGELYLTAYLVTKLGQRLEINQLRDFLREKLPEYMIPSAFVFLDILPLTPNGKIDKQALPKPDFEANREQEFIGPRNQIEVTLASIWQEVLAIDKIGIKDNFFALGGHSLLATQVISRIRHNFEIELPLRCLFESPTIEELGQYLIKLDYLKEDNLIIVAQNFEQIEL